MDPQTVNLTLSTSGVVPVSVSAYNANTLILSCDGDLSGGTFEELTAEIYQNANLGEGPLATVTYAGALGAGPHLLTFVPEQTNLLPSAPSILSRSFFIVVRGTGTGGVKTVFALGRLTLYANPASDIGAPPPAPSLYAANVFRYIAAAGSTTFSSVGRDDTLSFSVSAGANLSLNSLAKSVDFTVLGGSPWISGKQYAANTLIGSSGKAYICTAAHTSSASTQPETGGQWATVWSVIVSGGTAGDVFGPALSQDNGIAVYSGTTGKLLKASGATVTLTGAVACDAISLALAPATALSAGVFRYDSGEQVPEVGIGSVALKLGVQRYVRAYNDTASAMTKGQAVYLSGAQGNRVAVKLASAASEATSAGTLGLVAQSIAAGAEGFVQVDGPMYNLSTTGLTAGSPLYVSSTSGVLTPTPPAAPAHGVRIGYVERVHASVGSIFIKVDNGYKLGDLHDVLDSITGQVGLLVKNASTGIWEALTSAAALTAIGLDTALSNKADLVGGKLSTSQLPDLALVQYLGAAANQAAMLALVGQRGDWCTRTDDGKTYIVTAEPSSTLDNWTAMSYPASPVVSVAGRTGAVVLSSGDITGLGALATLGAVGSAQITDGAVTNAELANMAANTVKGSIAGGVPADLTKTQLTTLVATFTASLSGAVPAATGGNLTTEFLRKDGSWATPPGGTGTAAGTSAELQFRNASTGAFDAVANSTVTGSDISLRQNLELRSATATSSSITAPILQLTGSAWSGSTADAVGLRLRHSFTNSTNWIYDIETQHAAAAAGYTSWTSLFRLQAGNSSGNILTFPGLLQGFRISASDVCTGGNGAARLDSTGVKLASTSVLSVSSSTDITSAADLFLGRRAAANLRLGAADAASPVAQTLSVQSVVAGTASGAVGANLTVDGSQGTGTGAGGSIIFRVAPPGVSSTAQNLMVEAIRIKGTDKSLSFWGANANGFFYAVGASGIAWRGDRFQLQGPGGNDAGELVIGSANSVTVRAGGLNNMRLGAADAASPAAQTLSVQSCLAGTANLAASAAVLNIDGARGTGNGAGGDIVFRVAPPGTAGAITQNNLFEALRIKQADSGIQTNSLTLNSGGSLELLNTLSLNSSAWAPNALRVAPTFVLGWAAGTIYGTSGLAGIDAVIRKRAAANIALGHVDAASPVAQTISVQSATGTDASAAAAVLTLDGAQGTGIGAGGDVRVRLAPSSSTGASQNNLVEAIRFRATDLATVCAGAVVASGPVVLPTYTVSTVPSVSLWTRGMIFVSDDIGGSTPAFSDGTNWRRVADRAVVSLT